MPGDVPLYHIHRWHIHRCAATWRTRGAGFVVKLPQKETCDYVSDNCGSKWPHPLRCGTIQWTTPRLAYVYRKTRRIRPGRGAGDEGVAIVGVWKLWILPEVVLRRTVSILDSE